MPEMRVTSAVCASVVPLLLSACATTRVYSERELAVVAERCGVAPGEVIQEPDYPRFLFLYAIGPTREQLECVRRWSRRRHMHLSYIEAIDFAGDNVQAD